MKEDTMEHLLDDEDEITILFGGPTKEEIKRQERIRSDVEIIKPYLISKGYDFSNKSGKDIFAYNVARKDNLRHLSLGIFHYLGEKNYDSEYDSKFCQIIYDTEGKVLLDCVNYKSQYLIRWGWSPESLEEHDPSYTFMDDYVLIDKVDKYGTYYSIYKLENGVYSLVSEYNETNASVIKSSSGELFLEKCGELYSVREQRKLTNLHFKNIKGADVNKQRLTYDIKHIEMTAVADMIYNILQNNNLLFAYDYVYSEDTYDGAYKQATIFLFLDINGNIASKLYYRSEWESLAIDVDNESYEQGLAICRKRLDRDIKREESIERRKTYKSWEAHDTLIKTLSMFANPNTELQADQKQKELTMQIKKD